MRVTAEFAIPVEGPNNHASGRAGSNKTNRPFGFARFVFWNELFDGIEHLW
jgi:hypothetical protein